MKRFATLLAATGLSVFAAAPAFAQDSGAYVNVGVDTIQFEAYTASAKIGYDFNEFFGVEGQGGFGISDTDEDINDIIDGVTVGTTASAGIDNFVAAFARVKYPVGDQFEVFARGGYHFTKIGIETSDISANFNGVGISVPGLDASVNTDGFAIGAGAQFMLDEFNGIRVEYSYFDIDDVGGLDIDDFDSVDLGAIDDFDDIEDADFGDVGSDLFSIAYVRKF